jgi:iron complex transport system substrate-binding protein
VRVVSLLPAATEIVGALGALETLVGVTHECDWPPLVRSRLRVTRAAVDATLSPAEIDSAVRELSQSGAALYTMNARAIRDLHPDVILTQAVCDVCAVRESDVLVLAETLQPRPRIVTLAAVTLSAVLDDIARVAAALDIAGEGEELVAGIGARLAHVHDTLRRAQAPRPRVAVIEWTDPVFTGGHWIPEMIRRAGGVSVTGEVGERSRVITPRALQDTSPDVIIVAPCGFNLTRASREAKFLFDRPEWEWARSTPVWVMDANAYASRPGPRLVEGVEILARIMHPTLFSPLDPEHALRLNAGSVGQ